MKYHLHVREPFPFPMSACGTYNAAGRQLPIHLDDFLSLDEEYQCKRCRKIALTWRKELPKPEGEKDGKKSHD